MSRMCPPSCRCECRHAHRWPTYRRYRYWRTIDDCTHVPGTPIFRVTEDADDQAEISPPHARGLLSGWTQLMISWGFFAANWVGYGCQYLTNTAQFRVPLAIQIVPALILFV
jgi:hypothetical protein